MPFNELQCKTLQLIVYDFDRLGKDDRIGQISLPLESIDFGATVEEWRQLEAPETDAVAVSFSRSFGFQKISRRGKFSLLKWFIEKKS